MNKISADDRRFIDEYGRERIFYGINFGSKVLPLSINLKYSGDKSCIVDLIKYLSSHGINLIRYFVNWSYIEPQLGKYNHKVLTQISDFLDICADNEMYVILDMHQDFFATLHKHKDMNKTLGDGAPEWACLTDGYKYQRPKFVWAEGYFFSKAVQHCFDNFWNNSPVYGKGLQDHFCTLWKMLAEKFGNHPALLGFDLFNEPHPGTVGSEIFSNIVKSLISTTLTDKRIDKKKLIFSLTKGDIPSNVLSQYNGDILNTVTYSSRELLKKFDEEKYMPFINKVSSSIRQVTDKPIIFMEHTYFSNLGIPFSGMPITINEKRDKNQAFSPHGYDIFVDTDFYKYADNSRVSSIFNQRRHEQNTTLDVPILVGEWGGGIAPYDWLPHAEFVLDLFDSNKWSHCYWLFDDKFIDSPVADMLCRPHPVAVNGVINKYYFDKANQKFYLSFNQKDNCDECSIIFCHREIKSVITDSKYEIKPLSDNSYELCLFTQKGKNEITINF